MKKLLLSALFISTISFGHAQDQLPKMPTINMPKAPDVKKPKVSVQTPVEANTDLLRRTINANTSVTNFIPSKEAMDLLDSKDGPADFTKAIGTGNLTVYSILMAEMVTNLNKLKVEAKAHLLKIIITGFLPTKEDFKRLLDFLPNKTCGTDYLMTDQFKGYIELMNTLKTTKDPSVLAMAVDMLEKQIKYAALFNRINELCESTRNCASLTGTTTGTVK